MATIEEAKQIVKDTPISSILNYYMPLTKKGANFEGICPFHPDSHPSLMVNDTKSLFKCFACGTGGDAISFVKNFKRVEFIDALKDIGSHLGFEIEQNKNKTLNPKYEMAFRVLNAANKLYQKIAQTSATTEFNDFITKRKISQETLKEFSLGFINSQNALSHYLETLPEEIKETAIKAALEIGILRQKNNIYDFFRERVMIPIHDHEGRVRGFTGRTIKADEKKWKYLNSAESFIFNKRNILYGFFLAKQHIREKDRAILVEGNIDVLALHQHGFKYSVGTMGTALSERNAKLLTLHTKNIYLGLDSDTSGMNAMLSIQAFFMEQDILPKFLSYEPAKDPDDFLKEFGRLKLQERIDEAPYFIDFAFDDLVQKKSIKTTDQKLETLKIVFSWLSSLKNQLIAKERAIAFAKKLGLKSTAEDISSAFDAYLAENTINILHKNEKEETHEDMYIENTSNEETSSLDKKRPPPLSKGERFFLSKIVTHPEIITHTEMGEILDLVYHYEVKRFIGWLKNIYLEITDNDYTNFILKYVNEENYNEEINQVVGASLFHYTSLELNEKVIQKLVKDIKFSLKESRLIEQRDRLRERQKEVMSDDEQNKLLSEIQRVQTELFELKKR